MENHPTLQNLLTEIYLLEMLLVTKQDGITRKEFTQRWEQNCKNHDRVCRMSRPTFTRMLDHLKSLGFRIGCNLHNHHYVLKNAHIIHENPVMEKMINCLRDFQFVDKYRILGAAIQPKPIVRGLEYLFIIGDAMEMCHKLEVMYHPFGREAYRAILHPYCLKEFRGRWYVLAYKEDNEHDAKAQVFALDRMKRVRVMAESYDITEEIEPKNYFNDFYGIYCGAKMPIEKVEFVASDWASEYLVTQPLHHSQTPPIHRDKDLNLFTLRLAITPDFCNELLTFGHHIEVVSPESLRQEIKKMLKDALERYEE